jgi:hypothetical protein
MNKAATAAFAAIVRALPGSFICESEGSRCSRARRSAEGGPPRPNTAAPTVGPASGHPPPRGIPRPRAPAAPPSTLPPPQRHAHSLAEPDCRQSGPMLETIEAGDESLSHDDEPRVRPM